MLDGANRLSRLQTNGALNPHKVRFQLKAGIPALTHQNFKIRLHIHRAARRLQVLLLSLRADVKYLRMFTRMQISVL